MIEKYVWGTILMVSAAVTMACSAAVPAAGISPTTGGSTSAAGSLESATDAVRQACRAFYGFDLDEDLNTVPLSEPELQERCDRGEITWVEDCYDETRPDHFTANAGGCAVLGGYLAVTHGAPPAGDEMYLFRVGQDSWTIRPESD